MNFNGTPIQTIITGPQSVGIDFESIVPIGRLTTYHAEPSSVESMLNRVAGSILAEEEESIVSRYETYLMRRNENPLPYFITLTRNSLLRSLLDSSPNLLRDHMYLTLISHEDELIDVSENDYFQQSYLITLTKVMVALEKGKIIPASERNELLTKEFQKRGESTFLKDTVHWIISLMSGNDSNCEGRKNVLNYMNEYSELSDIHHAILLGERGLIGYNELGQELVESRMSDRQTMPVQELIKVCLTLFMCNYAVGDKVNAYYFLMKGTELNSIMSEWKDVLLFLKSTILLKNS